MTGWITPALAPLAARDAERDQLQQLVDAGGSCLIAGVAGIGKTRLAAEIAARSADAGRQVVRVVATRASAGIPFGAFAVLLPELDVAAAAAAVLQQGIEVIRARGAAQPVLLVVDDAQDLDDCSATLLLNLAQDRTCPVVVTMRTPSRPSEAVTTLWKDGHAERFDLGPLSADGVEALVEGLLGGAVARSTMRWLADSARGNPMYAREVVLGALQVGAIREDHGVWSIRQRTPAPPRLVDLIASRLGELSADAVDVVDLLAIGEPLPFDLLASLVDNNAVAEAERAGVVSTRAGGAQLLAGLSHPLFGDVRRQDLAQSRLRTLSGRLFAAYPRSESVPGDELVRLARWQLDSGSEADRDLLAGAASYARRMYDLELAVELSRAAISAGAGVETVVLLGEALSFSGRHDEAASVLQRASDLAVTPAEISHVASARSHLLGTMMGDRDGAETVLAEAFERVGDSPHRLALLDATSTFAHYAAEPLPLLDGALEMLATADTRLASRAAMDAGVAHALMGNLTEAVSFAERGLALRRQAGLSQTRDYVQQTGPVLALRAAGRFAEAERIARDAIAADTGQIADVAAAFEHLLAMVLLERGQVSEAVEHLQSALATNRDLGDTGQVRWCLGGLAFARALCGDSDRADATLDEMTGIGAWMTMFDLDLAERARAWSLAARADLAGARRVLRETAETARGKSCWVAEAFALHDLVRLGAAGQAADRLDELAAIVEGPLSDAFAADARARASRNLDKQEQVFERFHELGVALVAAELATEIARRAARSGEQRRAAQWRLRAAEAIEHSAGVRTPAMRDEGRGSGLTAREREIASLAAAGESSRDIAARLVVSVRTVDNHLQSTYTKLGVEGRRQLRTLRWLLRD